MKRTISSSSSMTYYYYYTFFKYYNYKSFIFRIACSVKRNEMEESSENFQNEKSKIGRLGIQQRLIVILTKDILLCLYLQSSISNLSLPCRK